MEADHVFLGSARNRVGSFEHFKALVTCRSGLSIAGTPRRFADLAIET